MSIPHVTSRGTKRESRPPTLWETLQEGNLRLQRQSEAPAVNMFFKDLIFPPPSSYLPSPSASLNHFAQAKFNVFSIKPRNSTMLWSDGDGGYLWLTVRDRRTTDNHRTFRFLLLPCNICKMLLFPTTPPHATNLHPRSMCTNRCRHMQTYNHNILYLCSGFQLRL